MQNKSASKNSLRERIDGRNVSDFSSATVRRLALTRLGRPR